MFDDFDDDFPKKKTIAKKEVKKPTVKKTEVKKSTSTKKDVIIIMKRSRAAIILVEISNRNRGREDVENYMQLSNKLGCTIVFSNGDFTVNDLKKVTKMLSDGSLSKFKSIFVMIACHEDEKD